jgi:23S rRNA pseudouridine2457 synthase
MTAAIGFPTLRIVRVGIGSLTLEKLELNPGEFQELNPDQIKDAQRYIHA